MITKYKSNVIDFNLLCVIIFRAKLFCDWRNVSPFWLNSETLAQTSVTSEICPNFRKIQTQTLQNLPNFIIPKLLQCFVKAFYTIED